MDDAWPRLRPEAGSVPETKQSTYFFVSNDLTRKKTKKEKNNPSIHDRSSKCHKKRFLHIFG